MVRFQYSYKQPKIIYIAVDHKLYTCYSICRPKLLFVSLFPGGSCCDLVSQYIQ